MNNSLRDEVESLLKDIQGALADRRPENTDDESLGRRAAMTAIEIRLRMTLDRHPPDDGVVVPRDLFVELRKLAYDAAIDATFPEDAKFASELVTQADAILSEGKA